MESQLYSQAFNQLMLEGFVRDLGAAELPHAARAGLNNSEGGVCRDARQAMGAVPNATHGALGAQIWEGRINSEKMSQALAN